MSDQKCCENIERAERVRNKLPDEEIIYETGDFFKVLGDSTRIKILFTLLEGGLCVGDISCCLGMSHSAVSHQLRVLRQSELVKYVKEGKNTVYSLDDEHVEQLLKTGLLHIVHKRGHKSNE